MLLIVRVDEYDEIGEQETARALPSVEWLRAHQSALEDVLGNKRRFELLMNAAADSAKGFRTEWITGYDPDWDAHNNYYTTPSETRKSLEIGRAHV